MDTTRDLSVGELLDQLLADSLIDACHITTESVTVVQGAKRHSFPYRQARTFLMGMLRGRSWNVNADEDDEDAGIPMLRAIDKSRRDGRGVPAASEIDHHLQERGGAAVEEPPSGTKKFLRSIGPALDEMLATALEMELIEGSSMDESGRTVTIVLSACQTQMQFDEAVVFLAECILYKLNAMKEDLRKQSNEAAGKGVTDPIETGDASQVRSRASYDEPVWQPLGL